MTIEVQDMTCSHCVGAITQALKSADKDAQVMFNLGKHGVMAELATSGVIDYYNVIGAAVYTAVDVQATPAATGLAALKTGGCCCGSR